MSYGKKLDNINKVEQRLAIQKMVTIEKAFKSGNPNDILKANAALETIMPKPDGDRKSLLIDPLEFNAYFGFKDKPFSLSYSTLKRMSKMPIINAIIKTRKNQVAAFAEPQSDKYSSGFVIRKKRKLGETNDNHTKEDDRNIQYITDFILNCGESMSWVGDDFDTFIRKITDDSLTYDQMTFETVRNRKGIPVYFFATDASTFRVADSYDDEEYKTYRPVNEQYRTPIKGYLPTYVQVLQNKVEAEFYPWELCFGTRNPSTSIYNNGYGISELEELVTTITSLLWSDEYNRRFFSQGSAPKGILKVSGNVPENTLQQFRQQWQSMITGVMNAWKTPVMSNDVEWIDLQKSNRDMEFTAWMEYLIKVVCAVFAIDPNEIGFNISNSAGANPMFETKNEAKLQHSKDKGLTPLLKFLQRKINRHLVSHFFGGQYEFIFAGLDSLSQKDELEMAVKKGGLFMTINELREAYDLPKLGKEGDIIANSYYVQQLQAEQQRKQQEEQQKLAEKQMKEANKFQYNPYEHMDMNDEDGSVEDNPFAKAFLNYFKES